MQNMKLQPPVITESAEEVLRHAEELVRELRQGNDDKANIILEQLGKAKEASLYREVGKMTRQLHDALETFRHDTRLYILAEEAIPDAKARLSHVISMTQQAADKTLTAVENTVPIAECISEKAISLGETWEKFRQRKLTAEEFRTLATDIEEFLKKIGNDSTTMRDNLNEVLMAQGYQDLTGQMIGQVITLVEEVEQNMVELVRLTGQKLTPKDGVNDKDSTIAASGPQLPENTNPDVLNNQDDVDDLLSSLGF